MKRITAIIRAFRLDDVRREALVGAISQSAHTGRIGGGKIFVSDLSQTVRIRTGETGTDAI